jgi:S-methylmethionine-dependent homocysteine/selenocysteine methylase/SAM-dependent methyltransferase
VGSPAYERIERLLAEDEAVILDGGIATELERAHQGELKAADRGLWGTGALYHAPRAVLDVHRRYVEVGCDVVSTNTWAILGASELESVGLVGAGLAHWMDVARLGLRLARQAVEEAGRRGETAVAFTVNGDVDSEERIQTLRLLLRVLQEDPPDILFLETMGLIRERFTDEAVEIAVGSGIPVWLSFRRCRHGVCGVYGQHWGGPEGDLFGRAAQRFEEIGVSALLVNCLPPDHVDGMLPWLRDFADLPLGAYPNLGYYSDAGWHFDGAIGPDEYAELALAWRAQGAQIIGGCCGTSPAHIAAAREALRATTPGRPRPAPLAELSFEREEPVSLAPEPWTDEEGRVVFPLPFPEIIREPDVFVPTQGSLLVWKYLWQRRVGEDKRCLDVGCGSGLLSIQLALNGARDVMAVDIQREAVANTLANAFRNGVSERVRGDVVDIYTYEPAEAFDVIVASLYQMPVDPFGEVSGHRPLDYWGRNMVDHFVRLLPRLLADGGVAYLMQLSIISQLKTAELLESLGLEARVADFGFFFFSDVFEENAAQIRRVEQLSDAYHVSLAGEDVMVAYLVEITRKA